MPSTDRKEIVRGSTVKFSSVFRDEYDKPISPQTGSATLYVNYKVNGVATTAPLGMTLTDTTWRASWDSSVADAGEVYWHVRSGGTPKSADQGKLVLLTNPANP